MAGLLIYAGRNRAALACGRSTQGAEQILLRRLMPMLKRVADKQRLGSVLPAPFFDRQPSIGFAQSAKDLVFYGRLRSCKRLDHTAFTLARQEGACQRQLLGPGSREMNARRTAVVN